MRKFIYDMINMTEGQKLIKYWWIWLIIMVAISAVHLVLDMRISKASKKIFRGDEK